MLVALLKKEFMEHVLSMRFVVASLLTVILVIISLIVLKGDYTQKKEAYDLNRGAYREQAERHDDYSDLELEGIRVESPPQKLQVSYYGLEKLEDKTAHIMAYLAPTLLGELYKSPVSALFPTPDMLYVVGVVLSLMAFVFSYDAVSGEREAETLKLALSYSVPRDRFILAKWLGGYLSLMTPFAIALVAAGVIIALSRNLGFTVAQWGAYFVAAVASFLFIAVMFSLGLFVSCRCARSATAIMVLLFIWVGMVLMVPNVSPYISNQITPVTAYGVVENKIRQRVNDEVRAFFPIMEEERRRYAAQLRQGGQTREQAQQELGERVDELWNELQNNTNSIAEEEWTSYERELNRQIGVAKMLSRISPVSSFVYITTDLAGTGVRKQLHFMRALREYQKLFRRYIHDKTKGSLGARGFFFGGEEQPEYDISDMPMFDYEGEPLSARLAGSLLDFAMLGIEAVVLFMAAFVSFLRVDVI
jgi:ABC-type transport system involved in multi-copper enzyme maturation permease subunit